jgi:hypothetical protein
MPARLLRWQHRRSPPETTGGTTEGFATLALEDLTLGWRRPCRQRRGRPRQADVLTPIPASAGDQASAKGERFGRTVIGTVRAPAEEQAGKLEACFRSWRQSRRFPREEALSGRPAHGQAHFCIGLVIAAATTVAAARPVVSAISSDGHLRRHHTALDKGQTHPEPQQDRQEQNARPMPGPAFHSASKMATPAALSKPLLPGDGVARRAA